MSLSITQVTARRFDSRLALRGLKVRRWAGLNGFNEKTVYSVLSGRLSGKRGGISGNIIKAIRKEIAA
jgi:gp16 family phage-associated protein